MLEEAIEVIRLLWEGGEQTYRGKHYTVDHARLYTLPEKPVPIAVAAAKLKAAELAGGLGDALVNTVPDKEIVKPYWDAGGSGPLYGQVRLCWAATKTTRRKRPFGFGDTPALAERSTRNRPARPTSMPLRRA